MSKSSLSLAVEPDMFFHEEVWYSSLSCLVKLATDVKLCEAESSGRVNTICSFRAMPIDRIAPISILVCLRFLRRSVCLMQGPFRQPGGFKENFVAELVPGCDLRCCAVGTLVVRQELAKLLFCVAKLVGKQEILRVATAGFQTIVRGPQQALDPRVQTHVDKL